MASSSKARQPRLRASCDGCFLAKVKCSKNRPMCSRCLSCGIECRYSPSSRAGKPPKSEQGSSKQISGTFSHPGMNASLYGLQTSAAYSHPYLELESPVYPGVIATAACTNAGDDAALFGVYHEGLAAGPQVLPNSCPPSFFMTGGEAFQDSQLSMSAPMMGTATRPYMTTEGVEEGAGRASGVVVASPGFGGPANLATWLDTTAPDTIALFDTGPNSHPASPSTTVSAYYSNPPSALQSPTGVQPRAVAEGEACTCFTVCLQSLQALHSASSTATPGFELVLSLNRRAVGACAAMLACTRCMSHSGTHTTAMLLATVIGKITSFYRNSSLSRFGEVDKEGSGSAARGQMPPPAATEAQALNGHHPGMMFPGIGTGGGEGDRGGGGYYGSPPAGSFGIVMGGLSRDNGKGISSHGIELDILARELRKLEDVYAQFREVCPELTGDPGISKAMIEYLGTNLGTTVHAFNQQQESMVFWS